MPIIACSIDGCERIAKARGWCDRHYAMWRRNGFPGLVKVQKPCSVDGCERVRIGKGYCMMHYLRVRRGTSDASVADPLRVSGQSVCVFKDCTKPARSKHLCSMHYYRRRGFGDEGMDRVSIHDPRHVLSYSGVHRQLGRIRGKAAGFECSHCAGHAEQWAFDHEAENPLIDPLGMPYVQDLSHYMPLCIPCHSRFDAAHRA